MTTSTNSRARQAFYWVSLVVLVLLAGMTVLDALDMHLLPRRSWSEGISPKVIQVTGSTIFHEYISIKREDVGIPIPNGVRTTFLGLAAEVHPTTTTAKLLLGALVIPEDLFLLAILVLLRGMILHAWKNPQGAVTPFIRANVVRLRCIAALFGDMWIYRLFLPELTLEISTYTALNNFGPFVGEVPPWFLTNGFLGVMILLLVLAEVFSRGVRLEKDVEGLV